MSHLSIPSDLNPYEYLSLDSRRTKRLNVLGIMNRQNTLHAYVSEQTINSDVIIACK